MTETPPLGEKPSRMPPAALGDVFGAAAVSATDRTRGLSGRLIPRAPLAPAGRPDDGTSSMPQTTGSGDEEVVEPRQDRGTVSNTGRTHAVPRKTVIVYIGWSVRDRLRAAATAGRTQTDVVLAALDATHRQLRGYFRHSRSDDTQPSGSLFSGRPGRRRLRHDEPQTQISLRVWPEDLQVIDDLVEETEAPNRSALVHAALDRHLPR